MKQISITIPLRNNEQETVLAYETSISCLFIHRSLDDEKRWAVTHMPTGRAIFSTLKTRKDAIDCVERMIPFSKHLMEYPDIGDYTEETVSNWNSLLLELKQKYIW